MNDESVADMDLGGEGDGEEGAPKDAFADIPADGGLGEQEPTAPEAVPPPPGESLGGDGAALGEEEELAPEEPPINGEEAALPEGQAADPLADPPPAEAPTPEPEPEQPESEPEPDSKPEAEAKKTAKGGGKKGTTERTYVVLQQGEHGWTEPIAEGIVASNGEQAIRKAYAQLVAEDSGDPITLAVIPAHFWSPKTVQAKVKHERAVEIS